MQKTVLVGVSGCIAAYKACEVVRGLQKAGVRVKVVMTEHATEFVGPTTFRSLTREPVAVGLFDDAPGDPIHHISLAKEADLFLIAPCTANVMAKMAHGLADDLLTTTALATTAPVMVAPAMNVNMYEHAATQANMQTLRERGVLFVEAETGYLACGDVGKGRLAGPDDIVAAALAVLEGTDVKAAGENPAAGELGLSGRGAHAATSAVAASANRAGAVKGGNGSGGVEEAAGVTANGEGDAGIRRNTEGAVDSERGEGAERGEAGGGNEAAPVVRDLEGKRVLITAGPTREPIDPARFISNRSSGKTGFALAREASARGADVTLVTGPVALADPNDVKTVRVETALEMFNAVDAAFDDMDIAIFSAAVCDARPKNPSARKFKKGVDAEALSKVELVENPDILATMGARKHAGQVVVGFAAETEHVAANARKKLVAKQADLIVGNDVSAGKGFATDDNQVVFVSEHGTERLPLMPKAALAKAILDRCLALLQ